MLAAEDMGGTPHDRFLVRAISHDRLAELVGAKPLPTG
jgi:D-aminopeptidase